MITQPISLVASSIFMSAKLLNVSDYQSSHDLGYQCDTHLESTEMYLFLYESFFF